MKSSIFKRIISAVMAAVVSAGMLSVQELSAFAELADSAQTQIPAVETDLAGHFGEALEDEGIVRAAGVTEGDYTYTVSDGKATITKYSGSATNLTIPSTLGGYPVTGIGKSAFFNYASLTNITIPDSVTSIGDLAFNGCTNLKSFTIPDSVTSIGILAFCDCTSLTSITIPDSVISMGMNPFAGCMKLSNIYVSLSNSSYCDMDGIVFSKDKTQIILFPGGRSGSYAIPDGVTSIGNEAFYYCTKLTGVTIPSSVTSIGRCAFRNCEILTSITIPDGVTSIGGNAFDYCTSLKNVTIPDSVTSIGNYAFNDCTSLTSITIPDGVTSIGDFTFSGCRNLTIITIPDSLTSIGSGAFHYCESLKSVTIPDGVTSIGHGAFYNCTSLTSITIPDGVTSIGESTFYRCQSITSITIPDRVASIGQSAFRYSKSLKSITIPEGVTTIGEWAFSGCESLTSITIPSNVTLIGGYAFNNCTNLTNANYTGTLSKWNSISIGVGNEHLTNNINIGYGNNKSPNVSTNNAGTITIKNENGASTTVTVANNDDYKLAQAQYNCGSVTKNILTNYYKIEPKSIEHDAKFTFQAGKTSGISRYILMCGDTEVARSSTGVITLKNTALPVGRNYYVIVLLNDSTATKTPLMFEVVKSPTEETPKKLELGRDGVSVKVPDNIPFVGGGEIGMDKIDLPVEILVCDGMAYVGVNISDTYGLVTNEKKRKEFEQQYYDIRNSINTAREYAPRDIKELSDYIKQNPFRQKLGGSGFDTEFNVIGYGKTEWDESGFKTVQFDLVFIFKAEYDFKYQTAIWVIPVTIEVKAELEAKLGGSAKYDFTNSQFSGELSLDMKLALKPFIGAGISNVAAVGAVGKGQLDVDITLLSSTRTPGIDDVSLTGGLGLKAYAGPFVYEKFFLEDTWHIYSRDTSKATLEISDVKYSAGDMYDSDNYTVSTKEYKVYFAGSASDGVLISDVFLSAMPQIVTSDSATVMTFLTSNPERSAADRVQLMYSVYNSEDGSWSEPAPVDGNNTNDWTHTMKVVNGDIWLLYQDSDTVFGDDTDTDALADSLTVTAMKFDPETGAFTEPVCISGTNGYNSLPALGTANSAPAAAWVNNEATDFFGLNSTNSVRFSTYSDGTWSEGVEIASGLNCVTDLAIGELDGKLCVAYITDGDNDLTTFDDRNLYLYSDGNTALLCEGTVSALYMGELPGAGNALCLTENGALYYITSADGEKTKLLDTAVSGDYTVTDDAILFCGDQSRIFAVKYDNGAWDQPVEVYSAEGTVTAFAADNDRLLAVDMVMTETENDLTDSSDLHCISYRETENVTLEYVDFEYENISTTVPLEVCVTNGSMDTLTAVNVLITDDAANEVYNGTLSCNIAPGGSEEITVTMPVETLDDRNYTVTVTTENDSDPADNSAEFTLGKTEIDLSVCTIVDGGKAYLEVTAENESAVAAGTVISILDEDGNTISQKDIGTLSAKSKATERFGFDDILGENDSRSVTVQLTVDKEEYYTHNNSLGQYIKAIDTDIPYKYVTFLDADGTLISGTVYDAEALITAPELPEDCTGWFAVGDETKTAISDFSGINVDIAFMAIAPEPPCSLTSNSLLLGGDIGVNFYMEFSDDVIAYTTSEMRFTVNGKTTAAPVSTAANTDGLYEFVCAVAPAELNDTITAQLYVGGQATGDSFTYSFKTYADYILDNSEDYAYEAPLVEAILNYGAAAEKYFRGSTEISFTKPEITSKELSAYRYVVSDKDKAYDFVGQIITLNNKITAKLYFSGDDFSTSDVTVMQNGAGIDSSRLSVRTDGSGTYLAISGISANEMGEAFTITLGGVTIRNYSVYSYVRGALDSTASGLSDVAAALYEYGCAAEEYLGKIA